MVRKLAKTDRPFFLYLHYLDPHAPYDPPPSHRPIATQPIPSRYKGPEKRDLLRYDAEIRFLDSELGRLFAFFRAEKLFDDALIFITGDHGEQFKEHGARFHENHVYNTETHVPLLFKLPGDRGRKEVDYTVSTIDIYASILSTLAIGLPKQGALSTPIWDIEGHRAREGVFSYTRGNFFQRSLTSLDGKKLIIGSSTRRKQVPLDDPSRNIVGFFDARGDYFEESPLTPIPAPLQESWWRLFDKASALAAEHSDQNNAPISDETVRQLKSLGYLN